jgi:hypothetical protein
MDNITNCGAKIKKKMKPPKLPRARPHNRYIRPALEVSQLLAKEL